MERAEERFWPKVFKGPEGSCWIWTGAVADDGYGRFHLHEGPAGMVRPHRYSYALAHGVPLSSLDEVMHRCDIPLCVNPACLEPGDHIDNMRDRLRKGRASNGSLIRFRGLPRQEMAARSRALRDEVLTNGWVPERIAAVIAGAAVDAPTLF